MAETDFIVAIELGSSKITGIAGRKESDGSIHVLAYAKEESSSFIRKGVIYNIDKTAQSLTSIINKLESALDNEISKVYVGIGGQSIRTVKNIVARHLATEEIITDELVDSIKDENRQIPLIDMDILDEVPQEYKIGINLQVDPVGVLGSNIEGRFLNIVARSSIKKNLQRCFELAKIEVADYYISPLAAADVILTDTEKRTGCALVDFGADTTTIAVYKNNILRYLSVLPLGGNNITRDICALQLEEDEAENLKVKYGNAIFEINDDEGPKTYLLEDEKRTIERKVLNEIIEARVEEIIANVWNQIELSGYQGDLMAGVIITGGCSNLKNLDEAIKSRTKINNVKIAKFVRTGIRSNGPDLLIKDGTQNTIIGLLNAGKENCCLLENAKPVETSIKYDAPEQTLFPEDDDEQEEYDEKDALRTEEERLRREEEKKRREEAELERKRLEQKRKEEKAAAKAAAKAAKKAEPSKIKTMFERLTKDMFSDEGE
ncbi:cell division protein FtsA [Bacteroides luti]|uniref:Cell division protein FtsA n=1 Tax=Bacteroides luti TaxID=1297750 RepID=A0A1M5A2D6_9BACE|nr:cell division protein FtsA [Bacteroides luti]SHF24421.1 cell division protein FtsA [Bacteroides luti]